MVLWRGVLMSKSKRMIKKKQMKRSAGDYRSLADLFYEIQFVFTTQP